jgi:stearoyl-CoA desaturase (delta-9 desaturase)
MKYLSASPLTVGIIHMLAFVGTIAGIFYFEIDLKSLLLITVSYVLYSCVGLGMMFHRYWTHKSFEFKNKYTKWALTWFGLMTGRGSIIGWVYVHREHHQHSDTENDPHIRNMSVKKVFFPVLSDHGIEINKRLIKDLLTKEQVDINKYYVLLILSWIGVLALIDPWLAYFGWFVPVFITNIVWNSFIFYGHSKTIGYKSYATKDNSSNSWIFSILILGEGWHNNHHYSPKNYTTKVKWWEFDPIGKVINFVKT